MATTSTPSEMRGKRERAAWRNPRARLVVARLAVVLALGGAVVGARLAGRGGGVALAVATLSAGATDAFQGLGNALSFGYAFAVGMAAAVNPCGIALLPTYLSLYLGTSGASRPGRPDWPALLGRALLVSATMTASFVALFGLVGVLLGVASAAVGPLLPWLSLGVGVLLVLAGGQMLAGGRVAAGAAEQLAGRVGGVVGRTSVLGYAAYGLAFALSSLGCALPLFLTVVGGALAGDGLLDGFYELVLYGLGMGAVIIVLTLAVALCGGPLIGRARRLGRFLEPLGAVLLLVTGAYVVYYWLSAGGLLA